MLLPIVLTEKYPELSQLRDYHLQHSNTEKCFGGISGKVENTHIENYLSAGGIITKQREIGISGTLLGLPLSITRRQQTHFLDY